MIVVGQEVKSQRELDALRLLMQLYDEHGNAVLAREGITYNPYASPLLLAYLQREIRNTVDVIREERGQDQG